MYWSEISVLVEPALGYEEEEDRSPIPSLTVHHIRSCLQFVHVRLSEVVDFRTTDKPEVLIKLKLQLEALSTRAARGCTVLLNYRLAGRMFRRKRPSRGRGIDQLVFLEYATRVWFRSLHCTFSV